MAPLTPHWARPSHPEIQEVIINEAEFTSKSLSRVSLPPFGFFAKMAFPPCTLADEPTYATVQIGRDRHLNLNSDLLYINHSCEPSLIFDTANLNIIAGPKGLKPGDELTFFYPSTEWRMAQPFSCLCGAPSCRGLISGASAMSAPQLEGLWLNGHIRELLEGGAAASVAVDPPVPTGATNGRTEDGDDPTAQALKDALLHAERVVEASRAALLSYLRVAGPNGPGGGDRRLHYGHAKNGHTHSQAAFAILEDGAVRRGATSRELSGEMGGDTVVSS